MNLSLYNIEQEYAQIVQALLEAGGETTPEMDEALALNKEQLQTKAVNYGFIVRQLEGEVKIIESELERLSDLKASRKKSVDKLKKAVADAMIHHGCQWIESPVMKLSLRASESVEIDDEKAIPVLQFMREKVTLSPDKALIKEALKAGEIVPGAHIQVNHSLQIK